MVSSGLDCGCPNAGGGPREDVSVGREEVTSIGADPDSADKATADGVEL